MKLTELKCDVCEKTKDTNSTGNENHNLNNSTVSDQSESLSASSVSNKSQVVVSKCLDCNSFMCAGCYADHQNISSFASHQMISLNSISLKENENENDESLSEQRKQSVNQLNSSVNSQKQSQTSQSQTGKVQGPVTNNHNQISNLQQLQQQFNNLEDQLRVKNKQQQQHQQQQQQHQPLMMNNMHQQQQNARLLQIENEIQKSYNFYTQMLKERKDYLINELNTIVQFAVLNHTQNYNKQMKLKSELEQKRANLELSDSLTQSFLSSDSSKVSPLNHDLNNNKINSNLAELNNLSLINDQIINQIKSNNPLQQIEFVSNYSAIQTSIRNTFGYIRINNQINAQQQQQQQQQAQQPNANQQQQQSKQELNFNSEQLARANLNNPASIYDYLTQMSKSQNQRSKMAQSELYIDLDSNQNQQFGNLTNNNKAAFNANNTEVGFENKYDYFGQPINTFSNSSTGSSKSVGSSSVSSFNQNNTIQRSEQRPIGSSHSSYETSSTSPISISTDNLTVNSCLPSNSSNTSSNYFLDQFSSRDWSSTNGISDLIQKPKSLDVESDGVNQLGDDFFNSTMVKSKSTWSSLINTDNSSGEKTMENMSNKSDNQMFSPYFNDSNFNEALAKNDQSPTLAALLNGHKNGPVGGLSKFNNHAITLSASSTKSSSSGHSGNSYFQNSTNNANSNHMMASEDQMHLSNSNNNNGPKIMSAVSSTSASPDDRISSLSSSASSACSESNYHDSSLATLKSVMKSTSNTNSLMSNLGHLGGARSSLLDQHSIANNANANANNTNLAVGSSTRSHQLRRSKMIYHCKFGEFGINDGQFTEPSGVTINTNNDIIVADTNSHRIQIFDKDGRFKFKFGECGKRDGQLLYPNRVSVVKHTGDIVVTERSPTHQIQIYNKYGQFLRKFGANILQHPRGVCVDNKGRIIVVECKVMRVLIFDLMGNVLQKFNCSKYLEFPNGVCCSSGLDREEIYISDNRAHCIKVFDYNGNFIRQIGGEGITNYPIGVGINSNNEILVADNHNNFNLTVFNQDGTLINALESKVKHAQCFDVGLMDDGSIVLASKDYRIYVYKYVNNNMTLSSSYTNENNQLIGNENASNDFKFEQREIMHNEQEQLYDLFSPQMNDLTNYNQLMGLAGNNQLGNMNNQSFAKSSDNLLDNLNFNCLMSN